MGESRADKGEGRVGVGEGRVGVGEGRVHVVLHIGFSKDMEECGGD